MVDVYFALYIHPIDISTTEEKSHADSVSFSMSLATKSFFYLVTVLISHRL